MKYELQARTSKGNTSYKLALARVLNPHLLQSATNYDIMKDTYDLERGLSEEQKAAEEEEKRKGRKASQLVNSDISTLQEGTYTWNGSDWVIQD